jgi:hypothetical protein
MTVNAEKPADLPVQQSTKIELSINLRIADPSSGSHLAMRATFSHQGRR